MGFTAIHFQSVILLESDIRVPREFWGDNTIEVFLRTILKAIFLRPYYMHTTYFKSTMAKFSKHILSFVS